MQIRKVMLVDDDPDILKIARLSLTGLAHWDVCTASSGKEAIQVATQETPDVILLDASMPDMDGVSVLTQLRQAPALKATPVFLTTTRIEEGEEEFYQGKGATGLIVKPFNPLTLPNDLAQKLGLS